jgi:uncharacterized integral membrane protein
VLSGRGLCDGPITRPEESYRLWCVTVCDLEISSMRRSWPTLDCCAKKNNWYVIYYLYIILLLLYIIFNTITLFIYYLLLVYYLTNLIQLLGID